MDNQGIKKIHLNSFLFLVLLLINVQFAAQSQNCNCLNNILLIQTQIEDNQASYQHQVVEQGRLEEYRFFKALVIQKAMDISERKNCIALLAYYLHFFHDKHSFIYYLPHFKPKANKKIRNKNRNAVFREPFEGIWYFEDASFSIEIFKAQTTFASWVAVMNKDHSGKWKRNQLKIELFEDENGDLYSIYWSQNLIPAMFKVQFSDSELQIGRNLHFYRDSNDCAKFGKPVNENFVFNILSSETCYIRLPSFDLSYTNKIDSLVSVNKNDIIARNNLIIDLRDNGGGGFDAFKALLPFVMDTHIVEPPYYGSVWVSEANLAYYESTKYDYCESRDDSLAEDEYVSFLKQFKGRFSDIQPYFDTIGIELAKPRSVAIIHNRYSGSSAEGFILQAMESGRVQTFGENSTGALSYGDWIPLPVFGLNIAVAITTKKMIFKQDVNYEGIGITPQVDLTTLDENKWVDWVWHYLENNRY